ncbi:hypothetical protein VTK56DRAFT_3605 [Thermocarpiscus australiensis]
MSYYQHSRQLSGFYGDLTTTGAGQIPMPSYDPYAVNAVPPLQIPTAGTAMGGPVGGPLPTQHRTSSSAWNQEDDQTLLQLRAMGKNWNQIQREAFPGKTGNACRKRHERLMERRGQNDFDNRKLERLCKEYMSMRKEIWQPLASRCGEKWNVVEQQCMSNGLKNIQSHARAHARRERLETGQSLAGYEDDGGGMVLTPVDDVADPPYSSSPETGGSTGAHSTSSGSGSAASHHHHHHAGAAYANMHASSHYHHDPHQHQAATTYHQGYGGYQPHHGYSNSVSSTGTTAAAAAGYGAQPSSSQGTSPYIGHGNRLPSVGDMGIDALINRGSGSSQNGV